MASGGAPVRGSNEVAHVSSVALPNEQCFRHSLPPEFLKDLLSNGVCLCCIFRQISLNEPTCSLLSTESPILSAILRELAEHKGEGVNNGVTKNLIDLEYLKEYQEVCRVCRGILQFMYNNDKGILVKKSHASDFAGEIVDAMKQDGHPLDSFSLEVSLPQTIVENEQAVRLYITKKYSSESWFREKLPPVSITVKDFLESSLRNTLEKLLDVKSNENSSRIHLIYTLPDASSKNHSIHERNGCYKSRKIDTDVLKKYADLQNVEEHVLTGNSSTERQDDDMDSLNFPLEKVGQCCSLVFQCCKTSIFVGGRYLKYSRNVSQSRWIIDDERMGEASVEEIVGSNILLICQGDNYKFHAAGREDIDVRMLGTGRPFLVEIQNARKFPSDLLIKESEMKINSLERKFVRVKNLKFLGSHGWELMREGEAEKQKQYAGLVWISRPLENDDLHKLSSLKDMQILQKTPIRVLHRRSPLEREKTIHWIKIERIEGKSQYFLLHLCTQAGTYIKEFVHGDLGRTHPSVGSILGCRAEILQLDVTDVKMDCFQE